ncbi:PRDX6 [Branchiostoma lanceolatum]|uniref:thioredoxin-dependent peroxiredoxin n=1 Tax=Branchiostoma lanceolatum TaxID=7740 RepID=A0A8K0A882_BRALA|nr:PRDX6 [Branchiostoma lanceolatum]
MPIMSLGDELPNFYLGNDVESGNLHDYISGSWAVLFSYPSWAVLFSYPRSFTPICTTELGRAAQLAPEFDKRGVKMLALSCDNGDSNKDWIEDVKMTAGIEGDFPIRMVADQDRQIAKALGLIDLDQPNDVSVPITCRAGNSAVHRLPLYGGVMGGGHTSGLEAMQVGMCGMLLARVLVTSLRFHGRSDKISREDHPPALSSAGIGTPAGFGKLTPAAL